MVTNPITLSLEGLNCKNKKIRRWYNYKKHFPRICRILHSLGGDHIFFTETGVNIVTELALFEFLFFNLAV